MSLREALEIYNTDRAEDFELLEKIFSNTSNHYCLGYNNSRKINRILKEFDNFDKILSKFELKIEMLLPDFKRYMLNCAIDGDIAIKLENEMREWAFLFPNSYIDPMIEEKIIEKYRDEVLVEYIDERKSIKRDFIYLKYMLLIRDLWSQNKEEQRVAIENFKNNDEITSEWIIDYILKSNYENVLTSSFTININSNYLFMLKDEKVLLKTINDLYNQYFNSYSYSEYYDDIDMINLIIGKSEEWLDLNELPGFIGDYKIELLEKANLIMVVKENNINLIKLTEIALSIIQGCFKKSWESDKYFLEDGDMVYIPHDSNPIVLSKYLFSDKYTLEDQDYLFMFKWI